MNLWKSLRGLPRDVWILAVATLINRAGMMVLPFLILYLTKELGFSAGRAGAVFAVYGVGAMVAAPVSGRLTDSIGPLPIMRLSLVLTAMLLFVYPLMRSFAGVVAVTFLWAIASELFRPANLVMIADVVPAEQLKPAYALSRLAINVGMSIGPAAAGLIAERSFGWIFVVDALTTLAAGAVLIATTFAFVHRKHESGDETASSPLSVLVLDDRRMLLFLVAILLTGAVFYQMEGPLPLFLVEDLHLSPAFYGALFTLNTVMIVFMEVPLNAATSHWPHSRGLALGALLFALGSVAFGFAAGSAMVIGGMIVWTFGEMLLFPQASAYVAEIAPEHRRGQYMGAYSLAFSIAFMFAPWAGTSSYATFGARPLWIGVFVVGFVSAIMMLRVTVEKRTFNG